MAQPPIMFAVRAAIVVEGDVKRGEVTEMSLPHIGDQGLFAPSLLTGANHDGRTVRVVCTDVDAAVASQFLEPDPDVRLDVLDQMPQMNVAIRVGQGRGNKNASCGHGSSVRTCKPGKYISCGILRM